VAPRCGLGCNDGIVSTASLVVGVAAAGSQEGVLNEFYRVAFRKKNYASIAELQGDLDAWARP
jgi:hypothetical protein